MGSYISNLSFDLIFINSGINVVLVKRSKAKLIDVTLEAPKTKFHARITEVITYRTNVIRPKILLFLSIFQT